MRLFRLLTVTLLLIIAARAPLHAQDSASPYAVVVPVADTSDAQRDQAFSTGLGQVLARVAGGQDLRDHDGYGEALGKAASMVQKFQYQRADTGLVLNVEFEPGSVRQLVSRLGVASAGIKPPVLLLVRDADGQLLGREALSELATAAAARGTDVAYPRDGNLPEAADLAAADPAALAAINQDYHTGLVLLGQLRENGADWTLVSGGQPQQWHGRGADRQTLLDEAGNSMVDRIGHKLNVIGAGPSEGTLWVSGLDSALDYAGLMEMLDEDPAVQQANALEAHDDGVLLHVKAGVPMDALAANLAAAGRVLLQDTPHDGADVNLRWLH